MIAFTFWFLAALVSTLVSGAAISRDDGGSSNSSVAMPGITWRGNITVDGPIYEFNGTIEEIYAQIKAANPEYKLVEVPRKHSASPQTLKISGYQCNSPYDGGWGYAVDTSINDGINYLRGIKGDCGVTPGPCGRVSCSWDSAIMWCWDNPTGSYTTKCSNLADYAQAAMDHCVYRPGEIWGTVYDDAGFSVQVAGMLHLC